MQLHGQENPEEVFELLSQLAASETKTDINRWLGHIVVGKRAAFKAIDNGQLENAIRWSEVVDFVYATISEKLVTEDHNTVRDRMNFRLRLIAQVGYRKEYEITHIDTIVEWLQNKLATYDIETVWNDLDRLSKLGDDVPLQTRVSTYLKPLRILRYWVRVIDQINEMSLSTLSDELLDWLQFKGKLP